jgi:hypothetical protein
VSEIAPDLDGVFFEGLEEGVEEFEIFHRLSVCGVAGKRGSQLLQGGFVRGRCGGDVCLAVAGFFKVVRRNEGVVDEVDDGLQPLGAREGEEVVPEHHHQQPVARGAVGESHERNASFTEALLDG